MNRGKLCPNLLFIKFIKFVIYVTAENKMGNLHKISLATC